LADIAMEVAKLATQVGEPPGDVVAVLNHDLPQADVLGLVCQVRPAIEERAELCGKILVAELIERRLDAPEPLLCLIGGLFIADRSAQPALKRLVDLTLHAREVDPRADEDARLDLLIRRAGDRRRLPRVVGIAG